MNPGEFKWGLVNLEAPTTQTVHLTLVGLYLYPLVGAQSAHRDSRGVVCANADNCHATVVASYKNVHYICHG